MVILKDSVRSVLNQNINMELELNQPKITPNYFESEPNCLLGFNSVKVFDFSQIMHRGQHKSLKGQGAIKSHACDH